MNGDLPAARAVVEAMLQRDAFSAWLGLSVDSLSWESRCLDGGP